MHSAFYSAGLLLVQAVKVRQQAAAIKIKSFFIFLFFNLFLTLMNYGRKNSLFSIPELFKNLKFAQTNRDAKFCVSILASLFFTSLFHWIRYHNVVAVLAAIGAFLLIDEVKDVREIVLHGGDAARVLAAYDVLHAVRHL